MFLSSILEMSVVLVILIAAMVICVKTRKLSIPAAIAGGFVGFLVFAGGGYMGLGMLVTFFLLGTLATGHKKEVKAKLNNDTLHPEQRKAGQVFANGGVAALMGLLILLDPLHATVYKMMLAASLAAATADTLSSELGMVYGRNSFNILTFKKEARGLDGVVSVEGTIIGALGAGLIATIYALSVGFDNNCIYILLAGIFGNLVDSVLGASLERRHFIGNDVVNFLNTLFAALVAQLLYWLF
jgi:uncharacterized protein (TIGR00297 family)